MPSVKSILLLDLITVLSEGNLELIYIYIYIYIMISWKTCILEHVNSIMLSQNAWWKWRSKWVVQEENRFWNLKMGNKKQIMPSARLKRKRRDLETLHSVSNNCMITQRTLEKDQVSECRIFITDWRGDEISTVQFKAHLFFPAFLTVKM